MPISYVTPWLVTCKPPLPMRFPRQEYWSGLTPVGPFPGDFPNSGIELVSPALAGEFFTTEPRRKWSELKSLSRVWLFATQWTVAYQASLSMRFSRQEYWSGLPFPSPGDLPNPGIKPRSPTLKADALTSEPPGKPTKLLLINFYYVQYSLIKVTLSSLRVPKRIINS